MGKPTMARGARILGRRNRMHVQARWTSADADDFNGDVLISRTDDVSGDYDDTRLAVHGLEWACSAGVSCDLYYDSMPPAEDSNLYRIPLGATNGEVDFDKLGGPFVDPVRDSPGNLVIATRSAADGDEISFWISWKEKGKKTPI